MAMSEKEREARQVVDVLGTQGMQNMLRVIREKIDSKASQITATKFQDLSEVARLQGEIGGLRQVLSYVDACEKRVRNGGS